MTWRLAPISALLRLNSVSKATVSTSSSTASGRAQLSRAAEHRLAALDVIDHVRPAALERVAAIGTAPLASVAGVGAAVRRLVAAGSAVARAVTVGSGSGGGHATGSAAVTAGRSDGWRDWLDAGTLAVPRRRLAGAGVSTSHAVSSATSACTWNCCASRVRASDSDSVCNSRISAPDRPCRRALAQPLHLVGGQLVGQPRIGAGAQQQHRAQMHHQLVDEQPQVGRRPRPHPKPAPSPRPDRAASCRRAPRAPPRSTAS